MGFDKDVPILVYTMGRVSSGSCSAALSQAGFHNHYHVHTMNEEWRNYSRAPAPSSARPMSDDQRWRYEHDRAVRRDIVDAGRQCLVVSLVREPLQRNMSAFFMNRVRRGRVADYTSETLFKTFLKRYPHFVPLEWYQREFKPVTGIDVFALEFDHDQGYQVIDQGQFRVLLLRTELDNKRKGAALTEFVGHPIEVTYFKKAEKFELSNELQGVYKKFREFAKFSDEFLDYMHESKYSRHFLTADERKNLRNEFGKASMERIP